MKKHFYFLTALCLICSTVAAQNEAPTTIYELLNLKEGGCSLEIPDGEKFRDGVALDVPPPPPPPPPRVENSDVANKFQAVSSQVEETFAEMLKGQKSATKNRQILLSEGYVAVVENGLFGLKDKSGNTILPPKFIYLKSDTTAKGFVGYEDGQCQYFAADGKLIVDKKYYHIEPKTKQDFVVRSKDGYGIFSQGKEIIPATNIFTRYNKHNDSWNIRRQDQSEILYWNDFKDSLNYDFGYRSGSFIGEDYLSVDVDFINLKTRKILICEKGYRVKVLDKKEQILAVHKVREKPIYLCDFEGNLLSQTEFYEIGVFNEDGTAVAALSRIQPGSRKTIALYGLIDRKGNWLIEPQFSRLYPMFKNAYQATDTDKNIGFYNKKGELIIPVIYKKVVYYKENIVLATPPNSDTNVLLHTTTGEILAKDIPYTEVKDFVGCGNDYYLVTADKQALLTDKNFKPITEKHKKFSVWNDYIIAKDYDRFMNVGDTSVVYTCDGKRTKLKFGKVKIDKLKDIKTIKDFGTVVTFIDETVAFVDNKNKLKPLGYGVYRVYDAGIFDWKTVHFRKGKKAWVNAKGELMSPYFEELSGFEINGDLAHYKFNNQYGGYFTSEGKVLFDGQYEDLRRISNNLFLAKKNNKWGAVDANNQQVIPFTSEKYYFGSGVIRMTPKRGKSKNYDLTGKELIIK